MKVKVINSSSIKTRERIKKAFALLIKEKQVLEKITVTDLVKKADITRSAFYTHYDNIYQVAQDLQNETFDILQNNINILRSMNNTDLYFDEIIKYLKENEEIYSLIFSSDTPLYFTNKLSKMINQSLYAVLVDKNIKNLELNLSFFIDGSISLIIKHYRGEINYSLDKINNYMKDTFKILFLN